jgi:hypothetical protein
MARPCQSKRSSPNAKAKAKRKAKAKAGASPRPPRNSPDVVFKGHLAEVGLIGTGWTQFLNFRDVADVATGFSSYFETGAATLCGYVFMAGLLRPDDPAPERWVDLLCRAGAAGMARRIMGLGGTEQKLKDMTTCWTTSCGSFMACSGPGRAS